MKRPKVIIASLCLMIFMLSVIRIGLVNSISTTGEDLVVIETQIKEYKKKNQLMKETYLEASSLTNLEKKAEKLGFVEAKSQVYLSTPLPLARR